MSSPGNSIVVAAIITIIVAIAVVAVVTYIKRKK